MNWCTQGVLWDMQKEERAEQTVDLLAGKNDLNTANECNQQ